jgi:hypothetical protein
LCGPQGEHDAEQRDDNNHDLTDDDNDPTNEDETEDDAYIEPVPRSRKLQPTATGLAGSDGGIFNDGLAPFEGSTGPAQAPTPRPGDGPNEVFTGSGLTAPMVAGTAMN